MYCDEIFTIPSNRTSFGRLHHDTKLRLQAMSVAIVSHRGTPVDWRDTDEWEPIKVTRADVCRRCGDDDNLTLHHPQSMSLDRFSILAIRTAGQNMEGTATSASQQFIGQMIKKKPLIFLTLLDIFWRSYKEYYMNRENTVTLCWDCHTDIEKTGVEDGRHNSYLKDLDISTDDDNFDITVDATQQSTLTDW